MVRTTGSQPRGSVKRRGSKWHAAETEEWRDTETPRRDRDDRDDPSRDPAREAQAPVLAQ
jgi:hypothetical protein